MKTYTFQELKYYITSGSVFEVKRFGSDCIFLVLDVIQKDESFFEFDAIQINYSYDFQGIYLTRKRYEERRPTLPDPQPFLFYDNSNKNYCFRLTIEQIFNHPNPKKAWWEGF